MKNLKIKLNEIFRTIALGRRYRSNRTFTLPKKEKETIICQTYNREIMANTNSRTIQLSARYHLNAAYNYRLHKKKKDSIIYQEDDNSNAEEQKAYIKKKNFYYKSSYIDSIEF